VWIQTWFRIVRWVPLPAPRRADERVDPVEPVRLLLLVVVIPVVDRAAVVRHPRPVEAVAVDL